MSIFRPKGSPYFYSRIYVNKKPLQKSTGQTSVRDARAFEARWLADELQKLKMNTPEGVADMTFGEAAKRYYDEVSPNWSNPAVRHSVGRYLVRLEEAIGPDTLLRDISTALMVAVVARRRMDTVKGLGKRQITTTTVNLQTVSPVQVILRRAAEIWKVPDLQTIRWDKVFLPQRPLRKREVETHEEALLGTALPPHHDRLARFARASGLRISECLIRWSDIDWGTMRIKSVGKGAKYRSVPINSVMRAILEACKVGNATEWVFVTDYHGEQRPLTYNTFAQLWKRMRREGQLPADLRIHDLRHDYGTKLLRMTKNIKLVKEAMGHSQLSTTERYAYVLDEEIEQEVERMAASVARKSVAAGLKVVAGGKA